MIRSKLVSKYKDPIYLLYGTDRPAKFNGKSLTENDLILEKDIETHSFYGHDNIPTIIMEYSISRSYLKYLMNWIKENIDNEDYQVTINELDDYTTAHVYYDPTDKKIIDTYIGN